MEPVRYPKGWYEDPRTQDDCRVCEGSACDGAGFVPGSKRLFEDQCCDCRECHGAWTPKEVEADDFEPKKKDDR